MCICFLLLLLLFNQFRRNYDPNDDLMCDKQLCMTTNFVCIEFSRENEMNAHNKTLRNLSTISFICSTENNLNCQHSGVLS